MLGQNRILSRKASGSPFRHAPSCVMGAMYRSLVRLGVMLISCIIIILLSVSAFSQSEDTTCIVYPLELFGSDVFYHDSYAFEVHHDTRPTWDINHFTTSDNEDLAADDEPEMTGGIYLWFREGTIPYRTFRVTPPLLHSTENIDSHRYSLSELLYTDRNLKHSGEDAARSDNWYDIWWQFVSFTSETRLKNTFHRGNVSLQYVQKTDNWLHDNLSYRSTDYSAPPAEPIPRQPFYLPVTYPPGEERGTYRLHEDSKLQNGGNVKLPLYIPWLRGKTGRSGLLPDNIYIATDIKYFNVAESLQSWKSGNGTLPSELNRLGSEWFDTRSGQIHLEWRLGE